MMNYDSLSEGLISVIMVMVSDSLITFSHPLESFPESSNPKKCLIEIISRRDQSGYESQWIHEYDSQITRYSGLIIHLLTKIPQADLDERFCFDLIDYLLKNASDEVKVPSEIPSQTASRMPSRMPSNEYWLLTFFHAIHKLPSDFLNKNIDVTALIFLKAYEFLSLKSDDLQTTNSQREMEDLLALLMSKIESTNRESLEKIIRNESLTFSENHQYDEESLQHYLLKSHPRSLS